MQQHQVIENRSIIAIENQLTEIRKRSLEKFTRIRKTHVSPKTNENLHKWDRNTTLIVGDSILPGIEERRISKWDRKLKNSLEVQSMTCTITSSHY